MDTTDNATDNIITLYQKYFTPQLCNEPVSETKNSLKHKLQVQLYKYGVYVFNRKFTIDDADAKTEICADVVEDAIEKCFEKWGQDPLSFETPKAYFSSVIWDFGNRAKKEYLNKPLSLDTTINNDTESSEIDYAEEKNTFDKYKAYFKFIDSCFLAKKRADWWKSIITGYFYNDLHSFFEKYPGESLKRYSFIDVEVYNFKEKPSQKDVAVYLQKDCGQLNTALNNFIDFISESYSKQKESL